MLDGSRFPETGARLAVEAALVETATPPVYQQIAEKAKHLHELKMSTSAIAQGARRQRQDSREGG